MLTCKYCKEKLNSEKARKDGFHQICHKKRGGTVIYEDCIYCKKKLIDKSNQALGFHPWCREERTAGKIIGPYNKTVKHETECAEVQPIKIQEPSTVREFLINSIIVTKKAFDKTSSLFKEADLRMGKFEKELTEEDAYEVAALEIEHGQIRRGLWAKAYAEANGDKQIQKAIYCKLRARQLIDLIELLNQVER